MEGSYFYLMNLFLTLYPLNLNRNLNRNLKEYIGMVFTMMPWTGDKGSEYEGKDLLSNEDVNGMIQATCDLHHAQRSPS